VSSAQSRARFALIRSVFARAIRLDGTFARDRRAFDGTMREDPSSPFD
jgi:hypothetical protein